MSDKTIGMLYLVRVRLTKKASGEKIKQRILVVGCEADDIERKLRWCFDMTKYETLAITDVEKVREKIHVLNTTVEQIKESGGPTIKQKEGTKQVIQDQSQRKSFAVGLATRVSAHDEEHAIRKVGHALINQTVGDHSKSGAVLPENTVLQVEEVSGPSAVARARDVSNEANTAHFVRG